MSPPVGGGVNDGVATSLGVVSIREVLDPSNHSRVAQTVAGSSIRVVFDIESTREGDAVGTPATTMRQEVVSLGSTRGDVWASEVITAADQASVGCTSVLRAKGGVRVTSALSRLDESEFATIGLDSVPVNARLVAGNVNSLWAGRRDDCRESECKSSKPVLYLVDLVLLPLVPNRA